MPQPVSSASKLFVRVAGVSGFLAVGLGAYGAHGLREKEGIPAKRIATFETGNRYHFLHTIVLLAVPMSRKPMLSGSLLSAGMLLFCGSCYVNSLTGYDPIRQVTPYGGVLLMLGWLSMAL
ncbi:hypothetical protein LSAT2_016539 [Lamellibrachia satsuma]|nr:hypothetical protein LSAT2_016539 [Lamellibrachia satsuma]